MTEIENGLFENSEEIINWTYPGATLYYKDCDIHPSVVEKFTKDRLIRNGFFLDVSSRGGGMKFDTRFLIASAKAAKLYKVNPDNERFAHCCLNLDSYFKVLDIYKLEGKTQIFLLHIPAKSLRYFERVTSNWDDDFIKKARKSLDDKIHMEPISDLLEPFWLKRTNFPVGMNARNNFFPLSSVSTITKEEQPLYNAIKNLSNDKSQINIPTPFFSEQDNQSKGGGFWSKIFGR
ncbi:hypothetical protein [Chryseobacterium sp. JK1]|uniref:hypothetical protein n=1 Tax=Chryseobacterium sp. JK1 TaxID=874294 RepID=UPI003D6961E9